MVRILHNFDFVHDIFAKAQEDDYYFWRNKNDEKSRSCYPVELEYHKILTSNVTLDDRMNKHKSVAKFMYASLQNLWADIAQQSFLCLFDCLGMKN